MWRRRTTRKKQCLSMLRSLRLNLQHSLPAEQETYPQQVVLPLPHTFCLDGTFHVFENLLQFLITANACVEMQLSLLSRLGDLALTAKGFLGRDGSLKLPISNKLPSLQPLKIRGVSRGLDKRCRGLD